MQDIITRIEALRKPGRKFLTNDYAGLARAGNFADAVFSESSAVLTYEDHGVFRAVYYSSDMEYLCGVLCGLPKRGILLDFITRDRHENKSLLEAAGFEVFAVMLRFANPDCRDVFDEGHVLHEFAGVNAGRMAEVHEAEEINAEMHRIFDTRVSHLLTDEEFAEAIKRREISIYRNPDTGKLEAVLHVFIQPQKFYISHVYNSAHKSIVHSLMHERLKEYWDSGGKYMYCWINEKNAPSIRFHQKYGMQHDGMYNLVYVQR